MTTNLLCPNPSKTEFLTIGLPKQLSKLTYSSDLVPTDLTSPELYTSPVRNLGVIFDKNLTFADYITKLSQTYYMDIRDLRRLRQILDYKTACTIATSIVHSKLDYCNSLFYSINSSQIKRLQTIQNALARAVTKIPKLHHITPVQKSLHWLKIPQRIHYKIASLTYNTSNLSTHLHSPTSHHPTTRVYSLIIISFLVSPSSLILFEVLQPLLCLRCASSLERTPKRPPSVYTSSQPSSYFHLSSARTLLCYFPFTTKNRTL